MYVTTAFSEGFLRFKKNFWVLISLFFLRLTIALGVGIVGVILLFPSMSSGLAQIFTNPDLLVESPFALQFASYFFFYVLLMIGLVVVLIPLLTFPHTAGAVLTGNKKRVDFKSSIELLKKHYLKLLIDGIIYTTITVYLFIQSILLFMAYPFLGFVFFLVALYVSVKLTFWDVLTLLDEKHPLQASWHLTSGNFWSALVFVIISNLLVQLIGFLPLLGIFLSILLIPFVSTSKVVFVEKLKKKA